MFFVLFKFSSGPLLTCFLYRNSWCCIWQSCTFAIYTARRIFVYVRCNRADRGHGSAFMTERESNSRSGQRRTRPEVCVFSPLISIYHFKLTCAHGRQNSARLDAAQVIQYSDRDLNCHVALKYSSHISGNQVNIFEHNDCRTTCWLQIWLSEQVFFKIAFFSDSGFCQFF